MLIFLKHEVVQTQLKSKVVADLTTVNHGVAQITAVIFASETAILTFPAVWEQHSGTSLWS